ncbi:MAG: TetR/AcrR family transcriptional regulator [Ignavibacterium album]|jgi:AcrR family transcriptional regulator|uniref:TetR/AcrR family transcriptional regulator n=1 Tax=Ignavibacterium album TaxID=591197 RepID=A0A7V2ZLL2_9BACT|nr:TetR/AcrR family transcriptional regulator [Ignavibacterium album]MCX8104628.1 TetR/AcrR family transcriptional regulator [Ignavibacterium album]
MNTIDTKKELILKTAREILARNGFAKTTLDDIANALGMKKSSLYYYYSNKEALLEDVMNRERDNFCLLIEEALKSTDLTINRILNYEKAKFEYVADTIKLHEVSTSVLLEMKSKMFEQIQIIHKKEIEMLKKVLDEGIKKKEIKKCDTHRIAELILTISEALRHREFYFASFSINKKIDFTKAVDDMTFAIKLIFEGLKV